MDDAELIQQFREADDEAAAQIFQTIVRKHSKFVFDCAFKLLKNHEDAEEVANDTFLKAFNSRTQLTAPEKWLGWLHTIATREAIDRLREADRQRIEIEASIDEPPLEEDNRVSIVDTASVGAYRRAQRAEARGARVAVIKRLIRLLPEEDQRVIALRYYDEFNHLNLTYKEIAEITGKTVKSVKNRVGRVKKLVKAIDTQLNDLLTLLPDEQARIMGRYLLDAASHEEIAEFLGISPQEVAAGLARVMTRWKNIIKQQRTDPVTTQNSQAGGVNLNLWLSFVKRVTRFMLSYGCLKHSSYTQALRKPDCDLFC